MVGGTHGRIERYDVGSGVKMAAFEIGFSKIHALAAAPDGLTFAVAGEEGLVACDADD